MIDEANTPEGQAASATSPIQDTSARAGYCQECGRSLTPDTQRRVGSGIFCDHCATLRQAARGWQPVTPNGYPGAIPPGVVPPVSSEPNPVFAGILGLIPGVGAMFNGQYAKGAMHLVVFVILLTMADNLNWVFYWLVWGWIFYQAFDAYHTARARRDNQPVPNPFGWNDIGERLGFHRPMSPPTSAPTSAPNSAAAAYPPPHFTGQVPRSGTNWEGYAPTPEPAQAAYSPYGGIPNSNPYAAPYTPPQPPPVPPPPAPAMSVQYAPTYTGGQVGPMLVPPLPPPNYRRFPIGAVWLIGLGMVFLMGNLLPGLRLNGRWLVPFLLAMVSLWSALRRWEVWKNASSLNLVPTSLLCAMVGPVMLMTLAGLLALQAGHVLSMHRSWPVLLVVWGGMLLLQRSAATFDHHVPLDLPATAPPPPVRSTSGTGSLGL